MFVLILFINASATFQSIEFSSLQNCQTAAQDIVAKHLPVKYVACQKK